MTMDCSRELKIARDYALSMDMDNAYLFVVSNGLPVFHCYYDIGEGHKLGIPFLISIKGDNVIELDTEEILELIHERNLKLQGSDNL